MKLFPTLHSRLVVSHFLVSLLSISLMVVFASRAILAAARSEVEHNLQALGFAAGNALEYPIQEYKNGNVDAAYLKDQLNRMFSDNQEIEFTLYMPNGLALVDRYEENPPMATRMNAPEVVEAYDSDIGRGTSIRVNAHGEQMLYMAVLVQAEVEILGILRLGVPLQPALDAARRSMGVLILVALLVASGISLFGWVLANNLARPIQNLTKAAEQLASGDLGVRVKPGGTQELKRLAESFNYMSGRLQTNIDELKAFVANASHELRTPLTVVKLRTEALRDGALEDSEIAERFLAEIDGEVDRLVRMVNDMLDLSRMEAGMEEDKRELTDLGVLATEVYETFSIRAKRAQVDLVLDIEDGLPLLMGNDEQLRRVLYNLVENAIKYTPEGGRVEILLRASLDGNTIRLLVKDTGPGIASEHLPHVFERFYRAETYPGRANVSKGSGLGLAIAKSIVENHGGKIGVTSQVGEGTTIWAELPAHAVASEPAL